MLSLELVPIFDPSLWRAEDMDKTSLGTTSALDKSAFASKNSYPGYYALVLALNVKYKSSAYILAIAYCLPFELWH